MDNKNIYFTNESLIQFKNIEGQKLTKVMCHLWVNQIKPNEPFELIDNITFVFDTNSLSININDDGTALDTLHYNYNDVKKALTAEFGEKVKIFEVDASNTRMWKDLIGKNLVNIKLTKENDYYLADALVLNFGQEDKREISLSPNDGLLIDFYEDHV
ncbi:MAG: hypothetical protein JSU07_06670 [Bacteroidetes bacterium]|nr:hypothetical protein [Bacteroidota bacterium]